MHIVYIYMCVCVYMYKLFKMVYMYVSLHNKPQELEIFETLLEWNNKVR